jgi:uncharacterized protein (DUF3084 family)
MDWLLVLLSFGCLVFIAKTLMEHVYEMREIQPRIEELLQKAESLSEQAEAEAVLRNEARARLPVQREEVRRIEIETEEARRLLQKAVQECEVLELRANQQVFRRGVATGRRAARHPATVAG